MSRETSPLKSKRYWTCLLAVELVLLALFGIQLVVARWQFLSSGHIGGVAIVDPSDEKTLRQMNASAALMPLVIAQSSDPLAKSVASQASTVAGKDVQPPFLMLEKTQKQGFSVYEGSTIPSGLDDMMRSLQLQNMSPLPLAAAFVGLLIASLFPALRKLVPWILLVAAVVAAGLFAFRCRTCPASDNLPLYGAILFTGLAYISSLNNPLWTKVVAATQIGVLLTQIALFYEQSWAVNPAVCIYCMTILGLNCLALTSTSLSFFTPKKEALPAPPAGKESYIFGVRPWLLLAPALIACYGFVVPMQKEIPVQEGKAPAQSAKALDGKPVDEFSIKQTGMASLPKAPFLLILGDSSCAPCRLALRWAVLKSPITVFPASHAATKPVSGDPYSQYSFDFTNSRIGTPTMFIVGKDKRLHYVTEGWSDSRELEEFVAKKIQNLLSKTGH